jgi:hypothetical protein
MHYEIDFFLLRNPEKKIIGFALMARAQIEAEYFVRCLLSRLVYGCASIEINKPDETGKSRIDFISHSGIFSGTYSICLEKEQAERIKELLDDPQKLGVYKASSLSPGIRIMLISEKGNKLEAVPVK